jgi:hypothetical protein
MHDPLMEESSHKKKGGIARKRDSAFQYSSSPGATRYWRAFQTSFEVDDEEAVESYLEAAIRERLH